MALNERTSFVVRHGFVALIERPVIGGGLMPTSTPRRDSTPKKPIFNLLSEGREYCRLFRFFEGRRSCCREDKRRLRRTIRPGASGSWRRMPCTSPVSSAPSSRDGSSRPSLGLFKKRLKYSYECKTKLHDSRPFHSTRDLRGRTIDPSHARLLRVHWAKGFLRK